MGKGKGGKNKRKAKKGGTQEVRELLFKDEEQEYAQVLKMLGNGRLDAKCADGKNRMCHIRGKFRKRVWINADDIILLGLRSFEDEKADVIHKYTLNEARVLKAYEELPGSWTIGGNGGAGEDDDEGGEVAFAEHSSVDSGSSDDEDVNLEDL